MISKISRDGKPTLTLWFPSTANRQQIKIIVIKAIVTMTNKIGQKLLHEKYLFYTRIIMCFASAGCNHYNWGVTA